MSKYLNIDNGERDTKFPIIHDDLWKFYKKQQHKIWTAEELDLSKDTLDGIPENEVIILKNLLAFFGVSDTLVQDNLADEIVSEFSSVEEIKSNYVYQAYIEDVHSETYSLLLMFFRMRYPQLVGLGQANELILQDEVLHMHFGINMHNKYIKEEYRLPAEDIEEMILGCYETEKIFIESIYGSSYVLGLPKEKLIQYIQYVTDSLLMYYNIDAKFKVEQPFDFMASFSIVERQNFFETKGGEYARITNIGGDLTTDDF
jgi:ribonucleoside-diphosphate reductase beta chain